MPNDRNDQFTADALAKVDRFIANQGGLMRDGVLQPGQGATNRVVFVRQDDRLIIFKIFCEAERKDRECFALRHWRSTGMVPELIWDIDATMIAMSHVLGHWLKDARALEGDTAWAEACRGTGRAVAALTVVPLSSSDRADFESRFYPGLGALESYLGRIVELGRGICSRDPDFSHDFWRHNLDFIDRQLNEIFAQPRVLYHQDVANFHVQRRQFMGFFDLEMCRVGCAAMQLGAALGMLDTTNPQSWNLFRSGWESAAGNRLTPTELTSALAAHYLLGWREISRYLSYNGTPGTGFSWASPANPSEYRRRFDEAERLLREV